MDEMKSQQGTEGMPVFVVKAKDILACDTIACYLMLCTEKGLTEQAIEVAKVLHEFATWRDNNSGRGLMQIPDHKHVSAGGEH